MNDNPSYRNTLRINKSILKENYFTIKNHINDLKILAVLKANAYGLGAKKMAEILYSFGVRDIGVADIFEARELAFLDVNIHILGAVLEDEITEAIKSSFIIPISSYKKACLVNDYANKLQMKARGQFLIDTGMGRLGMCENAFEEIMQATSLENIIFEGIYSHFSHAYADREYSLRQINSLISLVDRLKEQNISFENIHIANSDGLNNIAESFKAPFNMVRTGINLYGCFELRGKKNFFLKNALTLSSKIIEIRTLKKGSAIGYGKMYILPKTSIIGTIAIGYADGVPLEMTNQGYFIINGKKYPIIGRVSMDYTTVLLDDNHDCKVGDRVFCLNDELHVATWANYKGSMSYDIICSLGNRLKRLYS